MRLIKKHIWAQQHTLVMQPAPGFLEVLQREVDASLKVRNTEAKTDLLDRYLRVSDLSWESMWWLALDIGSAFDMFWHPFQFRASTETELEQKLKSIAWDLYLPENAHFVVKVDSVHSSLYHEARTRDLIQEFFNKLPQHSGTAEKKFRIEFFLYRNVVHVLLPFTFQPVCHRNSKSQYSAVAPLREDLAQCLIQSLNYFQSFQSSNFLFPFCGTGTFCFETLKFFRRVHNFSFHENFQMQWVPSFKTQQFSFLVKQNSSFAMKNMSFVINDINPDFLVNLERQLTALDCAPQCVQGNFSDTPRGTVKNSNCSDEVIMANPPFDIRIEADLKKIDDDFIRWVTLKKCSGFILVPQRQRLRKLERDLSSSFECKTQAFSMGGLEVFALFFK